MIQRDFREVTIANGQSLSPVVPIQGYDLIAIQFPAAWTAASLTFQGSQDGVDFDNIHDTAGEVSYTGAAADKLLFVASSHLGMFPSFLKLRSGTAGTPVNQGQDTVLKVILRTAA